MKKKKSYRNILQPNWGEKKGKENKKSDPFYLLEEVRNYINK